MPAADLALNLQSDAAAVPSFAVCLAWWFEQFELVGAGKIRARVEVVGELPAGEHVRRSLFLLHEFESLLGDRFTCAPRFAVPWPQQPFVNEAAVVRDGGAPPAGIDDEHALECAFTSQSHVVDEFAKIDTVDEFRRQLPVGIFDGTIGRASRWSPGGKSQIDLWAVAVDGRTVHLFELKIANNVKLGILPEALWYSRLLHRIRIGDFGGRAVGGGGPAIDAVRKADRVRMWLLTPKLHPLLEHQGRSPLEWFRAGLAGSGLDLGILPFEIEGDRVRLRVDRQWPALSRG
ncbi:MAG: hypothetical protein KIT84_43200 [Labilithrix sp.]|nr:hypothetical protein [Labilithrix sp.]